MRFCDFNFIVLCDGLFDAGFIAQIDAYTYIRKMQKKYPNCSFTIFVVADGDERELDRIWNSYQDQQEEWDR